MSWKWTRNACRSNERCAGLDWTASDRASEGVRELNVRHPQIVGKAKNSAVDRGDAVQQLLIIDRLIVDLIGDFGRGDGAKTGRENGRL